jgi:trehalose-phosphatase
MSGHGSSISSLPHALASPTVWRERLDGRTPAVFLDYDGVLTPIVDDPAEATLDAETRHALIGLAECLPVAIISGRDLADVRGMVDVPGLAYAGSHGFDLLLPDGGRERTGEQPLGALAAAEERLRDVLADAERVRVERKRYAIAVHTREADDAAERSAHEAVDAAARDSDGLRVTGGRDIRELRPDIDWDKGRALLRLADVLDLPVATHPPVYVGDDLTDEDAFAVIAATGVGVVVAGAEERGTAAHLRLDDPGQITDLLRLLRDLATKA